MPTHLQNTDNHIYYENKCIHHFFEETVKNAPKTYALITSGEKLTYQELNKQSNKLANAILALDIDSNLIIINCHRTSKYIIAILGILKAGYGYIPLDTNITADRLNNITDESKATLIITDNNRNDTTVKNILNIRDIILDTELSNANPNIPIPPETIAYTIFTSGSTGTPKGVMISHRSIVHYSVAVCKQLELPREAQYAHISTLAADLGLTMLFPSFCTASTLHLIDYSMFVDPEHFSYYIKHEKIDCLKITPEHFNSLLSSKNPEYSIPRKKLIFGGESLSWGLLDKVRNLSPKVDIYNHYGPSESTVGALAWRIVKKDEMKSQTVPLGFPLGKTKIYIILEDNNLAPIGDWGEIAISGVGLSAGYLNRNDITKQNFIANPFETLPPYNRLYKTGDIARQLPDGNIEFRGRKDFQVKIRGFRVEPEEIETILNRCLSIQRSIVHPQNINGGKNLVAYVIAKGNHIDINNIRTVLKNKLPDYMVPGYFIELKEFILNTNGKVDRKQLPKPTPQNATVNSEHIAPEGALEIELANEWKKLLKLDHVGVTDNFFEIGGHSLLAMQALQITNNKCHANLSLGDFFSNPTIRSLVKLRNTTNKPKQAQAIPLQRKGSKEPVFCICGIYLYQDLANNLNNDRPVYGVYVPAEEELIKKLHNKDISNSDISLHIPTLAKQYIQVIKEIQPNGPYHLIGVSFGGTLAYEIARQLNTTNCPKGSLIILDSVLPRANQTLLRKIKTKIKSLSHDQKKRPTINELRDIITQKQSSLKMREEATREAMILIFDRAEEEYDASNPLFHDNAVLITAIAARHKLDFIRSDFGWTDLIKGELETHQIPGDHLGILTEPHVQLLAQKIKIILSDPNLKKINSGR